MCITLLQPIRAVNCQELLGQIGGLSGGCTQLSRKEEGVASPADMTMVQSS